MRLRIAASRKACWLLLAAICSLLLNAFAPAHAQELSGIEAALPTLRQMNDPVVLLNALNGAAMQKMQAGDVEKAIQYIDESIAIARKQDDPTYLQAPIMTATQILNRASPERATKFLLSILSAERGNEEAEKLILQRLGEHLQQSGDVVGAIQVLHDFVQKCKKDQPKSESTAWALLQYGQACLNGMMFDLAQPALSECVELSTEIGRQDLAALADASLGNACLGTQQFDVAIKLFLAQLEKANASKDENLAFSAVSGLVTALLGAGELEKADTVLKNNLPNAKGMLKAELHALAATLAILRKQNAQALKSSQAAESARNSAIPLIARMMMGSMAVMQDKLMQAHLHLLAGNIEECLKAADTAESGYQQIRKQIDRAAKMGAVNLDSTLTGYSNFTSSISEVRQRAFIEQGKIEEALVEAEQGRGRTQVEAMKRLFSAEEQLASSPTIEQLKALATESGTTFVEYTVAQPLDFLTRSRMGPSGVPFDSKTVLVWVVTPDGKVHFRKVELPMSVVKLVASLREEILPPEEPADQSGQDDTPAGSPQAKEQEESNGRETSSDNGDETTAEEPVEMTKDYQRLAHKLLWRPIAEHLPDDPSDLVVIVPHSDLFAVPFAALLDEKDQPLIASHTIATSGSIDLYRLARERRKSIGSKMNVDNILVVGNPKMPLYKYRPDKPASPLDPLPGSESEAKAIASMFGIEPLIGPNASETKVKERMSDAAVLHFATHGLLETDSVFTRSYLSAIALTTDSESDGFLTVREVMNMELNAELAVLSACDSGRGKITGDGVVGLSRAYLTAGVPSVVVSLWPVSDRATAFMMVQFYKALGQGQSKAAALRTALLATREQTLNPQLWAPFMMVGFGQ